MGVETYETILINYIYEITTFCTSIISKSPDESFIIHERNLDFHFPNASRQIVFNANFYKNNERVYEAAMFAGSIGVYTGMRPNAFSTTENRRTLGQGYEGFLINLGMILTGYNPISWLIRETLETCVDFDCALDKYTNGAIIAPGYIILAGLQGNEGAVISRDRDQPAHIDYLNETRWYILQTNQDHWTGDCKTRCQAGNENMQAIGKDNITANTILDEVLRQTPNLNNETIF